MDKLSIFLNFDGNCQEVLDSYAKIFDTKIGMIQRYGDAPGDNAAGYEDKIMYSDLMIGDNNLMMSDVPPGYNYVAGNNFVLSYSSSDFDKLHRVFADLSDNGTVIAPMVKTFFSELYGMVTDKYGITWNIMA